MLSLVRAGAPDGTTTGYLVLIHHDDDGYTFTESFAGLEAARRRFADKRDELLGRLS